MKYMRCEGRVKGLSCLPVPEYIKLLKIRRIREGGGVRIKILYYLFKGRLYLVNLVLGELNNFQILQLKGIIKKNFISGRERHNGRKI